MTIFKSAVAPKESYACKACGISFPTFEIRRYHGCTAIGEDGEIIGTRMPHTDHLSDGVEYEEGCPTCKPKPKSKPKRANGHNHPPNETGINCSKCLSEAGIQLLDKMKEATPPAWLNVFDEPEGKLFNEPNAPSPENDLNQTSPIVRRPSIRESILGEAGYLSDELYGSSRVNPDAYAELMYTWLSATNDRRTPAKVVLSIGKCLKAISAISKDPHNTENYISLAANAAIAGEHAQRSKPIV